MPQGEKSKDYGKLVKVLQIITGVILLALMVVCIILVKKYNISLKNIQGLSEMIPGGPLAVAGILIAVSVVKSFALVFPPAVIFAVCGYMMPNFGYALLANEIGLILSLFVPYFLGRFTGAGMVDSLSKRFKAVNKLNDFAGANERTLVLIVKLSGILPGDLSSLLFGAMQIGFKNYFIGATLGMTPLVIIYTFFGIALKSAGEKPWIVAIPIVVVIAFTLTAAFVAKKLAAKTKNERIDENE